MRISEIRKGGGQYCSRQCASKFVRRKHKIVEKQCKFCKKIFFVGRSDQNDNFYCSRDCCYKDPEHLKTMSHPHTQENKKRFSELARKRFERETVWNKGKKCPQISNALRGEKSCWFGKRGLEAANYRGSNRPLYRMIRTSPEYIEWRKSIFERDHYMCNICDQIRVITVHHIIPFRTIIKNYNINTMDDARSCELLFDINNGITLCDECHHAIDIYYQRFRKSYRD